MFVMDHLDMHKCCHLEEALDDSPLPATRAPNSRIPRGGTGSLLHVSHHRPWGEDEWHEMSNRQPQPVRLVAYFCAQGLVFSVWV